MNNFGGIIKRLVNSPEFQNALKKVSSQQSEKSPRVLSAGPFQGTATATPGAGPVADAVRKKKIADAVRKAAGAAARPLTLKKGGMAKKSTVKAKARKK